MTKFVVSLVWTFLVLTAPITKAGVSVVPFDVDATPPLGLAMAYDPVKRVDELGLRCRGVVIFGADKPIV
jgi:hypothetical protein